MTDTKKVMLIVNPVSGKRKLRGHMIEVKEEFFKYGMEADIFTTAGPGDAERFVKDRSDAYDVIVCCGGDGTLNEVVNGAMKIHCDKPIGYIPTGSTNDFASSMDIPLKYKDAIRLVGTGKAYPHDIGKINDKFFHYTATFGIFTKCSYATPQKLKNVLGHTAYILQGALDVANIKAIPTKVICDGKDYSGEYVLGSVTNSLLVGGTLKYDKNDVDFADGLFELTLIRKPDKLTELAKMLNDVRKSKFDERYITTVKGKEFYFEFQDDVAWTADGEYGGSGKISKISCFEHGASIYRDID